MYLLYLFAEGSAGGLLSEAVDALHHDATTMRTDTFLTFDILRNGRCPVR